jgi:NAD(P)-dependent dehydrogenase (short-subunit alcohol dehydrogenase family)
MLDPMDFRGKVVLVTGGGKGVGRGISQRFLECGAEVVICGREAPPSVPASGGREALFVPCDLREVEQSGRLIAQIVERFGLLASAKRSFA